MLRFVRRSCACEGVRAPDTAVKRQGVGVMTTRQLAVPVALESGGAACTGAITDDFQSLLQVCASESFGTAEDGFRYSLYSVRGPLLSCSG